MRSLTGAPRRRVRFLGLAAAATLVALVAAGCGGGSDDDSAAPDTASSPAATTPTGGESRVLFDTDFTGVCSGAPQALATAYDKTKPGIHPILVLTSSPFRTDTTPTNTASGIPEGFTRQWAEGKNNLAEIELVACAVRTADTPGTVCDDYQDDGAPSDLEVTLHAATYEVTIYEATTGTALGSKTIEATAGDCPFAVPADTTDHYATDDAAVVAFITPFVRV